MKSLLSKEQMKKVVGGDNYTMEPCYCNGYYWGYSTSSGCYYSCYGGGGGGGGGTGGGGGGGTGGGGGGYDPCGGYGTWTGYGCY